ncbi:putative nicotianamine synthase 4 [Beauveria bassiana]|uniref:Putative nicotianamine synthase 4 n=1 Tax=Beauveria bassiana TaxID=176275 RepID=A0A2N6NU83_BEABA|nr:putative nicotianamine synthase 4 [Beauveria bassiana]
MSPPAADTLPQESAQRRDLEIEAQPYVQMIVENIQATKALCPLDTQYKVVKMMPSFNNVYSLLGFTTLDIDLENAVLQNQSIVKLMPDIRYVMGECEGALEVTSADKVIATSNITDAWKAFNTSPVHAFYEHSLKTEWGCIQLALGRDPESIAILGSGAMPETAVWVKVWAKQRDKRVQIHSLELLPERLEKSIKVIDALCDLQDCTFESGDIRAVPRDLREYDAVYFNASVGRTTTEKEDLLLHVVSRMRPGAVVLARSTHSIKTMVYPTQRVLAKLRPYMTCQLNGEQGKNVNASFIVSRVV